MINIEEVSTQKPILLATGSSITLTGLKQVCMKWLFPGLILALVMGPQPWAQQFFLGQMIVLVNDVSAAVIILSTFRGRFWPLVLIGCIIAAKVLSFIIMEPAFEIAYIIFVNTLLCIAGAVIAFERSELVYRQVMIICLLSVPFMILQSAGVGGWAQIVTATREFDAPDIQKTLFTPLEDIQYDIKVFRPAGLLRANTLLSLIILFALPLHLSRMRGKFPGGTFILCCIVVLSMAKVVFVGSAIIVLLLLYTGNRSQKYEVIKALVFILILFWLYAIFFPGLFEYNMSVDTISFSIYVRINDMVETLPEISFVRQFLEPYLANTWRLTHLKPGEHVSGYAYLIRILPIITPLIFIISFFYIKSYRRLRLKNPYLTSWIMPIMVGMLIYPIAFPIWETGIYWFMMSFVLLPFIVLLYPQSFDFTFADKSMRIAKSISAGKE